MDIITLWSEWMREIILCNVIVIPITKWFRPRVIQSNMDANLFHILPYEFIQLIDSG